MTRMHTLGMALLLAVSASALAQDKAAPAAPAAKPAIAPAATAAPAQKPVVAPVAPAAASSVVAGPAAGAKPAAAPTPAMNTAVAPTADKVDAPKKKRVVKRKPKSACTKLDDPWDNICQVQKNAELACKDLPTGKKAAKPSKKGKDAAAPTENRRQQCVDNYMRNV